MKNKAGYERILQTADELRLSIAEWADKATDKDKEKLAATRVGCDALVRLRFSAL